MFLNYIKVLGGVALGWALGANDAANVFGGAVASHMVRFKTACLIMAIFIIAGAILHGTRGIETLGGLAEQTINTALIVSVAGAITVTLMTLFKLPISTSQAVVGAIIGVGIRQGHVNFIGLKKVIICWIATPLGSAFLAMVLFVIVGKLISNMRLHFLVYDNFMRFLLLVSGSYSAYALGANNVANATGVFYQAKILSAPGAALVGGISIAIGAVTFSRDVMMTVGKKLLDLDAFSAFIVILSEAVTVHIFALLGVPVSTSQAVVGGVIGIGFVKGSRTLNINILYRILYAWFLTPVIGCIFSYIMCRVFYRWI